MALGERKVACEWDHAIRVHLYKTWGRQGWEENGLTLKAESIRPPTRDNFEHLFYLLFCAKSAQLTVQFRSIRSAPTELLPLQDPKKAIRLHENVRCCASMLL